MKEDKTRVGYVQASRIALHRGQLWAQVELACSLANAFINVAYVVAELIFW